MKILNIGSLNIDKVYSMDTFIKPGETKACLKLETFCGGKGLNQSIAAKKAGSEVYHAGKVGTDGEILINRLKEFNVNTDYTFKTNSLSGHAIIQVENSGQNNIILYSGANSEIEKNDVDAILENFNKGDILLLQNEISSMDYIINKGYEKGLSIVLNPSPMDDNLLKCDLSKVEYFIMNEIEAAMISGSENPEKTIDILKEKYPNSKFVITLGKDGSMYYDKNKVYTQGIFKVDVVDTTAAGDTFTGYFLNGLIENKSPEEILKTAAKASAIAVSINGASDSIPLKKDVLKAELYEV